MVRLRVQWYCRSLCGAHNDERTDSASGWHRSDVLHASTRRFPRREKSPGKPYTRLSAIVRFVYLCTPELFALLKSRHDNSPLWETRGRGKFSRDPPWNPSRSRAYWLFLFFFRVKRTGRRGKKGFWTAQYDSRLLTIHNDLPKCLSCFFFSFLIEAKKELGRVNYIVSNRVV